MQRLYVSDIDGTLLRSDQTLSPYARDTLNTLVANGLLFTLASARSVVSMRQVLKGLSLRLPVIEFNGAFLSDLATGAHLMARSLPSELAADLLARIRQYGHEPILSTYDGTADCLYHERVSNEGMRTYLDGRHASGDHRYRPATTLRDCLGQQVVCFTTIGEAEPLKELHARLSQTYQGQLSFHFFKDNYTPWHWLTAHDPRATKDQGIAALKEHAGIGDMHLTVFGDGLNDIGMFSAADTAVAVANADDELKRHADQIIGTNEEDSVVRYLTTSA
jgi:5-amino-6-(5-phospho-D-ribitylamino)uracil phosphatase